MSEIAALDSILPFEKDSIDARNDTLFNGFIWAYLLTQSAGGFDD